MTRLPAGSAYVAAALIVAVAVPGLLALQAGRSRSPVMTAGETVVPTPAPADPATGRRLFLDPIDPANAPEAEDAPKLVGIAGRLPDGAIAMVRAADGTTKTLSPGQSYEGWRLESISPDAALFTRGNRRVRSFLPAADPVMDAIPDPEAEGQ